MVILFYYFELLLVLILLFFVVIHSIVWGCLSSFPWLCSFRYLLSLFFVSLTSPSLLILFSFNLHLCGHLFLLLLFLSCHPFHIYILSYYLWLSSYYLNLICHHLPNFIFLSLCDCFILYFELNLSSWSWSFFWLPLFLVSYHLFFLHFLLFFIIFFWCKCFRLAITFLIFYLIYFHCPLPQTLALSPVFSITWLETMLQPCWTC